MDSDRDRRPPTRNGSYKDANTNRKRGLRVSAEGIRRLRGFNFDKEFSKNLLGLGITQAIQRLLAQIFIYARKHPILFGLQILGLSVATIAILTVPILGALGFSPIGPVAGTTAAAWQASIGLVEAGTLFAWCQSAAMGVAAVGGIIATGVGGFSVAAAASTPKIRGWKDAVVGYFRRF